MLTGTPLQNDLNELRNLLLLLVPQIFSENHVQLLPEVKSCFALRRTHCVSTPTPLRPAVRAWL